MVKKFIFFAFVVSIAHADITLLECDLPDFPNFGNYAPRQDSYLPGDAAHYHCESEALLSGEKTRYCMEDGTWSHTSPFCDLPLSFASTNQTGTKGDGASDKAIDGDRQTCSSTRGGKNRYWSGKLDNPGMIYTLRIFLPKGSVSYRITLLRENGKEADCDNFTGEIDEYDWKWHNCPNHQDATGLKIYSMLRSPLQICEIHAYGMTYPNCGDPAMKIENGRLRVERNTATLVCGSGYVRGPVKTLKCIKNGMWDRKDMYCEEREWELEEENPDGEDTSNVESNEPDHRVERPDREKLRPDRERLRPDRERLRPDRERLRPDRERLEV